MNTFSKASPFPTQDLSRCEGPIIHLHTRDSSSEIPPVTDTGAHSHRVVSRESYPTDIFTSSKPSIDKQLRSSCPLVVSRTNKLPSPRHDSPAYHCFSESTSSTARKPYKKGPRWNHPKVYAPAVRHVVEDGSVAAFVVNPSQQSDWSLGVYLAPIWKFNVTVGSTKELIGTVGFSIGAWGKSNVPRDPRGISKQTDITSTCSWRQRVHSRGTNRTWKRRENGTSASNTLCLKYTLVLYKTLGQTYEVWLEAGL